MDPASRRNGGALIDRRQIARTLMILPVLALAGAAFAAETATLVPPPSAEPPAASSAPQTLVISGGCFWGVQAV